MNGKGDKWFDGDSYISAFTLPEFILGVTEKAREEGVEFEPFSTSRVGSRYSVRYTQKTPVVKDEVQDDAAARDTAPEKIVYSEEYLTKISESGMEQLREIGSTFGVKDISKTGLIAKILQAQADKLGA